MQDAEEHPVMGGLCAGSAYPEEMGTRTSSTGDLMAHCRDLTPHLAAEKGEGLSMTLESITTKLLAESRVSKNNFKGNGQK